jgi:hypothetical protein
MAADGRLESNGIPTVPSMASVAFYKAKVWVSSLKQPGQRRSTPITKGGIT